MVSSLQNITMKNVLKGGFCHGHLSPHPVVKNITQYFFTELYMDNVEELRCMVQFSPTQEEYTEKQQRLQRIIRTFSVVQKDYNIESEERLLRPTKRLLGLARILSHRLSHHEFVGFSQFMEYLIVLLLEDQFRLTRSEDFEDESMWRRNVVKEFKRVSKQ
jgi:hypothetical protein